MIDLDGLARDAAELKAKAKAEGNRDARNAAATVESLIRLLRVATLLERKRCIDICNLWAQACADRCERCCEMTADGIAEEIQPTETDGEKASS